MLNKFSKIFWNNVSDQALKESLVSYYSTQLEEYNDYVNKFESKNQSFRNQIIEIAYSADEEKLTTFEYYENLKIKLKSLGVNFEHTVHDLGYTICDDVTQLNPNAGIADNFYNVIENHHYGAQYCTDILNGWDKIICQVVFRYERKIQQLKKVIRLFKSKLSVNYNLSYNIRAHFRCLFHFLFKNLDDESSVNYLFMSQPVVTNSLFLNILKNEKRNNNQSFNQSTEIKIKAPNTIS